MIKALPGLAAAVGSFVGAYGTWRTAALGGFLSLRYLWSWLGQESSARGACGHVGACWEHGERAESCGAALFWHLATRSAGEVQLTSNVYQFVVEKAKDVQGSEVSCASSRAGTLPCPKGLG